MMTPAPIVVEVPGSRNDAINIMVRNGLTGLPVVRASDGKLVGVVSRRDIFRKFEEDQLSMIMKKNCITLDITDSVSKAAEIFSTKRIHRLPVVENGKLVGIVTPTDLLRIIKDMKTTMVADEVINTTCVTAYEDEPMSYTVPAMRISDVPALPVLNDHGELVGILTDRDLFRDQMDNPEVLSILGLDNIEDAAGYVNVLPLFYSVIDKYRPDDSRKVKDFMVRNPTSVFKKTNLAEVAKIMVNNDFGQLPVHGTKDELVGIIYDVDVVSVLAGKSNE
ncbi:MAG: CBS domain-containing protein [Candidatus Methanomethylophilaceae archaeon]|nr:CBS domain-containing protein [Candidatus Methanomethylophilaceae archaeon]